MHIRTQLPMYVHVRHLRKDFFKYHPTVSCIYMYVHISRGDWKTLDFNNKNPGFFRFIHDEKYRPGNIFKYIIFRRIILHILSFYILPTKIMFSIIFKTAMMLKVEILYWLFAPDLTKLTYIQLTWLKLGRFRVRAMRLRQPICKTKVKFRWNFTKARDDDAR